MAEIDPLEARFMRKTIRQHVQEFGCVFGILFLGISGYMLWKGNLGAVTFTLLGAGVVFPALTYGAPRLMHPLWKGWMALAHKIAMVANFIILLVAWVGIFLPMAYLLKLLRVRVMDTSFSTDKQSYWEDRDKKYHDFALLERQF